MCGLQPLNMAAPVSWTEAEGCTVHIITVRKHTHTSTLTLWHPKHNCIKPLNVLCDSPVIQKIRQDCSKEFVEFERCLRENQDTPTSCSPHVARFLGCAETVDLSGVGKSLLGLAL